MGASLEKSYHAGGSAAGSAGAVGGHRQGNSRVGEGRIEADCGGKETQAHHIGDAVEAEFAVDVGAMMFDGAGGDAEQGTHFLVGFSFHDQGEQMAFARGEVSQAASGGRHLFEAVVAIGVDREGLFDEGKEGAGGRRV
jgi:hypothetical protein